MKMIRPFDVTDVALVSTTVTEADYAAYVAATTYAVGDRVIVVSPSLAVTISNSASTGLPVSIAWTAHGWSNGQALSFTTTGALPGGLSTGTRYYIVEMAANIFSVSLTRGGSPILTTSAGSGTHTAVISSHKIYESLVASNVGNTPHKSPDFWLDLGATNRWKCFDGSVTSQTERADTMKYVLQTKGRVDSIALMNVSAAEVVIHAVDRTATVTISNGSPAVVTWTAHAKLDGEKVYFTTTGALPAGLTASTFYYVVNAATDTFNVALTAGGTPINTTDAGSGTHTAHSVAYGPNTYDLHSSLEVSSYWSWFFEPITHLSDFVDMDFPPYANLEVTITINDTGSTVKCGAIVLGLSKFIGDTKSGASVGIDDYSVKTLDDFGNYTITERAFRKRASFNLHLDRSETEGIIKALSLYRATPVVYVGSSDRESTIIYGFYRDFSVILEQADWSVCNIEIEGLT
jgi:hypothetical protein